MTNDHLGWASTEKKRKCNVPSSRVTKINTFAVYNTFRRNVVDKHQCVPLIYSRTAVKS